MHRILIRLARIMAILGGLVLSLLILLVCASITGRALNAMLHSDLAEAVIPGLAQRLLRSGIGPINGDFELVEAGMAFAVFAFIPLCQITAGHAAVDIFTSRFSKRAQDILQAIIDIVFAIVLVVIAVQLKEGMDSKLRSGQTTFLLQFPVWWAYALSLSGAIAAAVIGVHVAVARLIEIVTGRIIIHPEGTGH
ncbi:MAG: TRAP transporter small permease [Pseudomonadota bacterium]